MNLVTKDAVTERQETKRIEACEQAIIDLTEVVSAHVAGIVQGWTYRDAQDVLAKLAVIRKSIRG